MAQGIKFEHGQLEEALAKAQKENKLVFVDVYTNWCGPCKQMVKNIFPLKEVGDFYNKNFISYKLDAEDASIKGPEYAEKYKVRGFPTYLFLKPDGTLEFTTSGAMDAEMFIKVGRKALGEELTGDFDAILAKYSNGDKSDETLFALLTKLIEKSGLTSDKEETAKLNKTYKEVSAKYFSGSPEKFLNKDQFAFLKKMYQYNGIDREHETVKYIINHYNEFKSKIEEKELGTFLMYVNYSSIRDYAFNGSKEKYESYLKDINGKLKAAYAFNDESKIPALKFLTAMGDAEYAIGQKDYDTYLKKYKEQISYLDGLGAIEYLMPARRLLNRGEGTPTQEQLKKCIPFNQIAYDKYKNAYVCTDFGLLMAKLGNKEKAKEYYAEAFEMLATQGARGQAQIDRFKKEMADYGL